MNPNHKDMKVRFINMYWYEVTMLTFDKYTSSCRIQLNSFINDIPGMTRVFIEDATRHGIQVINEGKGVLTVYCDEFTVKSAL